MVETSFVVEAASMLSQSHVTDDYVKMLMQQNNRTARKNDKKQRRNSLDECSGDVPAGTENSHRSKYQEEPPSSGMTTPSVQNYRHDLPSM